MMLPHRRPRTVYRVCGEEEYLAGADPFDPGATLDETSAVAPAGSAAPAASAMPAATAMPAAGAALAPRTGRHTTAAAKARPRPARRRLVVGAALIGAAGGVGSAVGLALAQGHPAGRAKRAPRIVAFVPARPAHTRERAAIAKRGHPTSRSGSRQDHRRKRKPAPITRAPGAPTTPGPTAPAPTVPRASGPSPRSQSEFGFER